MEKLTNSPFNAVAMGAAVTAVIQSSSATTITAWILSLAGIESGNFLLQMCKPSSFCPILAVMGVVITMFCKNEKKKNLANILIGFAILMTGMDTMSAAVKPLRDVPEFTGLLTKFSNPFLGLSVFGQVAYGKNHDRSEWRSVGKCKATSGVYC